MTRAWTVMHVVPCVGDPPDAQAFAYTHGVFVAFGKPNVWVSYLGACGHRLGTEVAHGSVNELVERLIKGDLASGRSCDLLTGAFDILRFTAGSPVEGEAADAIEAWPPEGGPVLPLSWRCSLDVDWRPV